MKDKERCVIRYIYSEDWIGGNPPLKSYVCDYDEAIKILELIKHTDNIEIEGTDADGIYKVDWVLFRPASQHGQLQIIYICLLEADE